MAIAEDLERLGDYAAGIARMTARLPIPPGHQTLPALNVLAALARDRLDNISELVGADAAGSRMQTLMGRKLLLEGGAVTALHWAINSVKKGGIVSIVGVYGPIGALVPIGNVVNKGITIRANQASVKRLLPRLIEHVRTGVLTA